MAQRYLQDLRDRYFPKKVNLELRNIEIGNEQWTVDHQHKFLNNRIMTAKYTWWSFVPKFLFEQFLRLANFYFLIISIIQMSDADLAPTGQYYTFFPLLAILLLTAIKELIEDIHRHRQDRETNVRKVDTFRPTESGRKLVVINWEDVLVGDLVKISSDQQFPADLLLLASSEPEALCYVETSNLDGETNLKIRQGVSETSMLQSSEDIIALKAAFSCEAPNNRLYNFDGTLKVIDKESGKEKVVPIGPNQILLRGSQLKNTQWVYGMVIYTGHESKLLMNASAAPIKTSRVEKMVNKQILAIFVLLFLMAFCCLLGFIYPIRGYNFGWDFNNTDDPSPASTYLTGAWYLYNTADTPESQGDDSAQNMKQFVIFIVLFNTIVPISLYLSIEIVKYVQGNIFINSDLNLYYEEEDVPAVTRTSNLNEDLGQIDFIFSDKTGTLTRNQMEFRKMSIAGIKYGLGYTDAARAAALREGIALEPEPKYVDDDPDPNYNFFDPSLLDNLTSGHKTASFIREFLSMLAVCHTVIPERDKNKHNKIVYHASSPDEAALVIAAKKLGFYFNVRKPDMVKIMAMDNPEEYKILNVLEFNSTRKRMSVIVRTGSGKIKLYCKGADSVIYERLASKQLFKDTTLEHLNEFANEGLRTLCIAMTELDEDRYEAWNREFIVASTSLVNRAEEVDRVAELIERDLFLVGATAIEDKLQDQVPETIESLLQANIRIWMLTGDKRETAINIGYTCQLLRESFVVLVCDKEKDSDILQWTQEQLNKYSLDTETELALVIDGRTLTQADQSKEKLLELAIKCKACICCRVSPIQKANMVTMVKKRLKCTTLAIGDGANDVTMIQAADVGIGISGREGLQASRSADYSIGQFRFLKRLLLVHGTQSYRRLAKVILYSFYKTLTLYLVSFYFSFYNGFSGQVPWDKLSNALWNVIYTFLPIILLGFFDQDLSADMLERHPELYKSGQRNEFFNLKVFFGWFFTSIYHSLLIFLIVAIGCYSYGLFGTGHAEDIWTVGTVLYFCVLLTVTLKIALITSYFTNWNHFFIWISPFLFTLVIMVCGLAYIGFYNDATVLFNIFPKLYGSGKFWFIIIFVPIFCISRDFIWKYYRRNVDPLDYHIIQENMIDEKKRRTDEEAEMSKVSKRALLGAEEDKPWSATRDSPAAIELRTRAATFESRDRRRSGYAFSQVEGVGIVTQATIQNLYDSEKDKPDGR